MTRRFTFSEYVPGSRRVRFGAAAVAVGVALLPAAWVLAGTAQAVTPTPVLLGTAGNFAILAGSGITNTGASTILGDVGSSPTSSETGFGACPAANCVTLTGTNHTDPDPNDAATQQAKAALTTAYNNAAGQTPTVKPTELAGQQLVAGVYNSASGTFGMTGTLVLDGENNPDAIFIFQTDSTLITGVTGNVTLIRGAQACNVFWKVGSAATLGTGSTFRGTILAHDTISLGDGVTVDGRLLGGEQASGAGAVTLIHDTITRPTCTTPVTSTTGTATTTTGTATTTTGTATTTTGTATTTTGTATTTTGTATTTTGTATTTTGTGGTGGTGTGGSGSTGAGTGNTGPGPGAGTGNTGAGTGTGTGTGTSTSVGTGSGSGAGGTGASGPGGSGSGVIPLGHPETGAGGASHSTNGALVSLAGLALMGAGGATVLDGRRRRVAPCPPGPGRHRARRE